MAPTVLWSDDWWTGIPKSTIGNFLKRDRSVLRWKGVQISNQLSGLLWQTSKLNWTVNLQTQTKRLTSLHGTLWLNSCREATHHCRGCMLVCIVPFLVRGTNLTAMPTTVTIWSTFSELRLHNVLGRLFSVWSWSSYSIQSKQESSFSHSMKKIYLFTNIYSFNNHKGYYDISTTWYWSLFTTLAKIISDFSKNLF